MENVRISLKATRANADMSIKQWAQALGVNTSTVINWEKGRTTPSLTQVRRMSELASIPIDIIFLADNTKK